MMNKQNLLYHFLAIVFFSVVSYVYLYPLLEGKKMEQHDVVQVKCMTGEMDKYLEKDGRILLWTNSMFGGMPTYQIRMLYPQNIFSYLSQAVRAIYIGETHLLFLLMLGMYVAVFALTGNFWIAGVCALGFAFGSFNTISIDAGHISKVRCIAMIAPCIAAVILAFRGKMLAGAVLLALALGFQIRANHLQITYYTFLLSAIVAVFLIARNLMSGKTGETLKAAGLLAVAALLAVTTNITSLLITNEYSKETIRGGQSELSSKQSETPKGGLDKGYAFSWSYGVKESFTLIVPYFMGGASAEKLDSDSYLAKKGIPKKNLEQIPTYWGDQPFTAGPTYFGIILVFLFLMGLFIVKDPIRWVFLGLALLTLMMSWGKNFMEFNALIFEYLPFYNKFRTPSMIMSAMNALIVLTGGLALAEIWERKADKKEILNALKFTAGGLGLLLLIFALFGGSLFDFSGEVDAQLRENGWPMDVLIKDRIAMMTGDAFRSLFFLALAAGIVFLWATEKIKPAFAVIIIGALVLVDGLPVSARYLNKEDFISKAEFERNFKPSKADLQILQDTTYYRVLDITGSPFTSANSALFHKSVGGYNAAKMRRYQELIEGQIMPNLYNLNKGFTNEYIPVLNMLNTKYFIGRDNMVIPNSNAMGNAWFVQEVKTVETGDEEMAALSSFDPGKTAFVHSKFSDKLSGLNLQFDSSATIRLLSYDPEKLVYETEAATEQFAVFSEIYYNDIKGWYATIDGQDAPYVRANYVLRAMRVPAGKHRIEFFFKPKTYYLGEKISLASSILLLIGLALAGARIAKGKEI